ncbi:ABC1 kinase family protein [Anaerotardibacter muris]|uniref:ABC1 kinase family protein n=1 Tax=Anaerotardibacter muris TaxID=2941505 RepID=UPI00203F3C65|nr:lipopolysaccharide core heptose(II) kinase RfaY [Anaerotardibacter muris]
MSDNTLLRHFLNTRAEVDPADEFGLSRSVRVRRVHEIVQILRRHNFLQGFSPEELRDLFEDLGPSFIKVGQTLSTRSEILPQAYCKALSQLQQECEPMSYQEVLEAIEAIYGADTGVIFDAIDPKPLGSASLAQVHKARLATGQIVAIKVQRPGVRVTMAQDIDVMRSLARRLSRYMKDSQMVDLRDVVEELWVTFLEETDFLNEARNLVRFNELNADVVYVRAPKPYMEYCREEVLVMEYVDGISIRNTEKLLEQGYVLDEIGDKMLENYAKQILEDGFFHADPHPGNIVIDDGQIVYLDLGLMGHLNPRDRTGFENMVEAVGLRSSSRLMEAFMSFSISRDLEAVDQPRLLSELDIILDRYGSVEVEDIDIGQFLNDIMNVTRQSKVQLPPSVTMVSRGIVTMEGTLLEYVGSFNIIDIINKHIKRSKEDSDEVRELLKELVVSLNSASRGALRAAEYSGDTMQLLSRGQLKVNMEMLGSAEPMVKISRILNRLTIGLIVAGLLVSAALLTFAIDEAHVFGMPILAFIEFVVAIILSLWIAIDIYRRNKKG